MYRFGEQWLRAVLLYLSNASWARELVTNLPLAQQVAKRFVAGESIDEAIAVARQLNHKRMRVSMDFLGESVNNAEEAFGARDEIITLLEKIQQSGVEANISIKPSQLGVKISDNLALENMRQILTKAKETGNWVRMDMEESALVDTILQIYRTLRAEGFDNVGVVLQAYLYRTEEDVRQLIEEGAKMRLCKGAYAEPPELAFPIKADTDANYISLMNKMLDTTAREKGVFIGIATHDQKMIAATKQYVREQGISAEEFEFQMLYGIRRELQDAIVDEGYFIRVYVPYGTAWYPYFMRRLAERPANLWFFLSNFVKS